MRAKVNIGVLCSGNGTNFEQIALAVQKGEIPNARIACLILDRQAKASEVANRLGIESLLLEPKDFPDVVNWMGAVKKELLKRDIGLVVLAGFLRKIEAPLLEAYPKRVLNIHPALLPKFGGKGMYGMKIHESVIASGSKESGVTVHLVDEFYDHGPIIFQEKIPILPGDTAESLGAKVLAMEHSVYPKAIASYIQCLY